MHIIPPKNLLKSPLAFKLINLKTTNKINVPANQIKRKRDHLKNIGPNPYSVKTDFRKTK